MAKNGETQSRDMAPEYEPNKESSAVIQQDGEVTPPPCEKSVAKTSGLSDPSGWPLITCVCLASRRLIKLVCN